MDRIEEEPEEHVAKRGFPRNLPVHEEPGLAVPRGIVHLRNVGFELCGVLLVRGDRFRDSRSGSGDVAYLTSVDELAGVVKLARTRTLV